MFIKEIIDRVSVLLDAPISTVAGEPYQQTDNVKWINDATDWVLKEVNLEYIGENTSLSTVVGQTTYNYPGDLLLQHPSRVLSIYIQDSNSKWKFILPRTRQWLNTNVDDWRNAANAEMAVYWYPGMYDGTNERARFAIHPPMNRVASILIDYYKSGTQYTGGETIATQKLPQVFEPYLGAIVKYIEARNWQANQNQKDKAIIALQEAEAMLQNLKHKLEKDFRVEKEPVGTSSKYHGNLQDYRENY